MERRHVGGSGLRVSRLGLGTAGWGRDTDEHEARDQLVAFCDAGGTLLDTAYAYANGASEEMIGGLLGSAVARDEIVLATKAGAAMERGEPVADTSRGHLLTCLDTSLRRLGVDHVDLWQVHLWSDDVPLEETLRALDQAVTSGRAAYVGVSNYSGWQSAQAATWMRATGRSPLVSNQVEYSLLRREIEAEVVPAGRANDLSLLCFSPLGRGILTGKYRTGTPSDSRGAHPQLSGFVDSLLTERNRGIAQAVAQAADGLGWSPLQVALAWVRDRPGVAAALVGARTVAQLTTSLATEELTLPAELIAALDDVSDPAPVEQQDREGQ